VTVLGEAGIPAVMVDAAELLHFRRRILRSGTVLIAVSQSGESAEVVRLMNGGWPGAPPLVASVTNGMENSLARAAALPFDTGAGTEVGPSTITFATALVVLSALAGVLAGEAPDQAAARAAAEAERAAAAVERLLDQGDQLADRMAAWIGTRPMLALLGRGTARATAEMAALLLKEAARLPAESLESGQFRHGPLELAGPDLAVAIVATEPVTRELDRRLAEDLTAAGAAVLMIEPGDGGSPVPSVATGEVEASLGPAVAMVPLQLLSWRLAVQRGRNPSSLTLATKVTTRE
jgi:glucosamine--fructose-6-phosphate aminotransferase (isomerizing)